MFLINYITGRAPLWRAFWLLSVLLPLSLFIVYFLALCAAHLLYPQSVPIISHVFDYLILACIVLDNVCLWQCAKNCKSKIWTWLVIGLIIVGALANLIKSHWVGFIIQDAEGHINLLNTFSCYGNITFIILCLIYYLNFESENRFYIRLLFPILIAFNTSMIGWDNLKNEKKFEKISHLIYLDNGIVSEDYELGKSTKIDKKYTILRLKKDVAAGDFDAAFSLSEIYADDNVLQKDDVEAFTWLKLAADHGIAFAKNNLANKYVDGKGIAKNPQLAMKLYQEASNAGDDQATYNLGLNYELGTIGTPDYKTAVELYKKVIDQTANYSSINCAVNDLGALYALGKGVPQNDNEAIRLFKMAAMKKLTISLPDKSNITSISNIKNFDEIYAAYRLVTVQHKPLDKSHLSTNEIAIAKAVADYYQTTCRQ